jgi:hypothetical protein
LAYADNLMITGRKRTDIEEMFLVIIDESKHLGLKVQVMKN